MLSLVLGDIGDDGSQARRFVRSAAPMMID